MRALQQLCKKDKEIHLTIGGDGPLRRPLEELCIELDLQDQVTFLGSLSREQVQKAFQNADAFVLASQHETFGVVCIEALASGVPVVATRCGGTEDIIENSVGYLVEVNDGAALAAGMQKMVANFSHFDPHFLHNFAKCRFSPQVIAEQYKSIYRNSLNLQ